MSSRIDPPPTPTKWRVSILLVLLLPVVTSMVLYKVIMEFDAAELSSDYPYHVITVPNHKGDVLKDTELIGDGQLPGHEDLAYDPETRFVFTGCGDGWIKRFKVDDDAELSSKLKVENWSFVGGRPLGVAFGPDRRLYVANAYRGLQAVERDGTVKQLTEEADGVKFGITDGIDVASDGVVYFTDASYKYHVEESMLDVLEGRPYGRLLRFDPNTNCTEVLLSDLYFANGVAIAPDQNSLIICEPPMSRCRRYHIHGDKRGAVDDFIQNVPGFPDNIRYDESGRYWIGILSAKDASWDLISTYPFSRNLVAFLHKRFGFTRSSKDGGILEVSRDGETISLRTDRRLAYVTGGIRIGNHLYLGNLVKASMGRIDLTL